jgi:hypothetical protein
MHDGYNTIDGEEVFFISHPALGLWASADRFKAVVPAPDFSPGERVFKPAGTLGI